MHAIQDPLIHDNDVEGPEDLPPAYDALSIHHSTGHSESQHAGSLVSLPVAGPGSSNGPTYIPEPTSSQIIALNPYKPLPSEPPPVDDPSSSSRNAISAVAQLVRARKDASWLSYLPFVSSISAKRVRQTVLSVINDLVLHPSRLKNEEQKNVHEVFVSIAETCAENKLSLSTMLQEVSIADHTPMYWAIVSYREDLLVALLVHSRPLSVQTISDIRRACLVSSNQTLFHALRVRHPPFHVTDGIQVPSPRAASDNLLLNNRPLDEISVQRSTDQGFVVSFEIPLWQRRMKAIGQVSIEFIASGRMWSVAFFSTNPSAPLATSGKARKGTNTWHVKVNLLETSPPTFFVSQIEVSPPLHASQSKQTPRLREVRSTTFSSSRASRSSHYDRDYDRTAHSRSFRRSEGDELPFSSSSRLLPPPIHPLRGSPSSPRLNVSTPPPISIHLESGTRKLSPKTGTGDPSNATMTKPEVWASHGVGYTSAVISPLGEGPAAQLLHERVISLAFSQTC